MNKIITKKDEIIGSFFNNKNPCKSLNNVILETIYDP